MKQFLLIIHQVRRFFHAHRTFYIFFILAQCVAIVITLYGAATIQTIFTKQEEIDEYRLYFDVDLIKYYDEEGNVIFDTTLALSLQDMQSAIRSVLDESPLDDLDYVAIRGKYDHYSCGVTLYDNTPTHARDTVALAAEEFPDKSPGDTIEFAGHRYTVSNISKNYTRDIWFPANAIPDDMICYDVWFGYQSPPTTAETEEMKALLAKYFDYDSMVLPKPVDPLTAQFNATVLLCSGLMIIAVLINICYAQRFRFRLERHSLAVYRLCGCSTNTIFDICMGECIMVTIVLYLLCALLFHAFLRPLIIPWYEAAETLYTLRFYALFGGAYLLLQMLLLAIPLQRFVQQGTAQAEKGATQ